MYAERPSAVAGAVLWAVSAEPGSGVLPDGCMDLLWIDEQLVVAGPDTRVWNGSAASAAVVGLRFPSGVAPSVLGVPAWELRDQRVPLVDLWPRAEVLRRQGRLARGSSYAGLEELAGEALSEAGPLEPIRQVARMCAEGRPVSAIGTATGWSERTLHRRCLAAFGYGAKTLSRVLRFRRATTLIGAGASIADAAQRVGYADQAHLSREVKELSGRSAATFRG